MKSQLGESPRRFFESEIQNIDKNIRLSRVKTADLSKINKNINKSYSIAGKIAPAFAGMADI